MFEEYHFNKIHLFWFLSCFLWFWYFVWVKVKIFLALVFHFRFPASLGFFKIYSAWLLKWCFCHSFSSGWSAIIKARSLIHIPINLLKDSGPKPLKPCSAQGYIPVMQGQIRDSAPSWETPKGQRIFHAIYNLPAQKKNPRTLAGKSTWNNKTKHIFSFDQRQNIKIKEENRQESK